MTRESLSETGSTWEHLAQTDPLWAILSDPAKRGGGWDLEAFFATGEAEIDELMTYVDAIAPALARGDAFDFGCGVGRLTRPLGRRFQHATGLDIAPTMIEAARQYAAGEPCDFAVNASTRLEGLDDATFDFVYSAITLQHVPGEAALGYVREFIRVLKPGGLAVFQLPARRRLTAKSRLIALLPRAWRAKRFGGIEMHGAPRQRVIETLQAAGAELVDVVEDGSAGDAWEGYRYAARRR